MAKRILSGAQERSVAESYRAGTSANDIATAFGVTNVTVYKTLRRLGTSLRRVFVRMPIADRIAEAQKNPTPDGCWNWVWSRTRSGYGMVGSGGKVKRAHRVVYELLVGPIPDGLQIDHLCRNKSCVNPAHMEPVTHRVNTLRGTAMSAIHAAKTHCPTGHAYDDANTHVYQGRRYCRACRVIRQRRKR
jgi:hypothetical protein